MCAVILSGVEFRVSWKAGGGRLCYAWRAKNRSPLLSSGRSVAR